jgi:hypothetical protein
MKQLIVLFALITAFNVNGQEKQEIITNRFGLDIGLGVNHFNGKEDDYTKLAIDFGLLYEYKEKLLFGFDISFSPKKKYDDTGVDGSRSSHIKWDGKATCYEPYVGYRIYRGLSLLYGFGYCHSQDYEVMKGYKNKSSYKRSSNDEYSQIFGAIYNFEGAYDSSWYLKFDCAIGDYNRYSIGAGLNL